MHFQILECKRKNRIFSSQRPFYYGVRWTWTFVLLFLEWMLIKQKLQEQNTLKCLNLILLFNNVNLAGVFVILERKFWKNEKHLNRFYGYSLYIKKSVQRCFCSHFNLHDGRTLWYLINTGTFLKKFCVYSISIKENLFMEKYSQNILKSFLFSFYSFSLLDYNGNTFVISVRNQCQKMLRNLPFFLFLKNEKNSVQ